MLTPSTDFGEHSLTMSEKTSNASPAARTIEILRTQSLTTIILGELERMILSGELKPGDRVNEKALAARHEVSRGPIREACRRLEQAGLVEIIVNRGVFVRRLETQDAADLCDIRANLAGMAGRLVAERISPDELDRLRNMVQRMENCGEEGDISSYYALNIEFHAAILEMTRNDRLERMCSDLDNELYLFRRKSMGVGHGLQTSLVEHRAMIAAFEARDADSAERILVQHALSGKERLLNSLEGEPETVA